MVSALVFHLRRDHLTCGASVPYPLSYSDLPRSNFEALRVFETSHAGTLVDFFMGVLFSLSTDWDYMEDVAVEVEKGYALDLLWYGSAHLREYR